MGHVMRLSVCPEFKFSQKLQEDKFEISNLYSWGRTDQKTI